MLKRIRNIGIQMKLALRLLVWNDPLRLAGATAFFATFALPFILIILVQVLSLIFNRREISHDLYVRMSSIIGEDSMEGLVTTIRGFRGLVHSPWAITAGSLFMIFVSTTLFRVIKNSFNQLWMIRVDPELEFRMSMASRLKSLILILFTGVLFVAGGVLEALQVLFGKYANEMIPGSGIFFNGILSFLISVLITSTWFTMLIHYIPDGRPGWKISFSGALLTSLLFALGKFVLKRLLVDSHIEIVFGRSASFVLVLLFIFYSAMILYYGAAFTKLWAIYKKKPIQPLPHAEYYKHARVAQKGILQGE